ncbi:hypothetical protein CLAFUW4_13089 [Fulvia fulva]|uniref:Uncharacterized protein n=1 Tax=Passalora fulva TaxID=5499 RepID=A0A9Q8PKI0_PASFU|nr:uncharacterized protein CLAFUR5_12948 [Fulvia fulva]KAK4611779.1 hypothetical protein CLAFUR4_13093 [Fulvia fulva]KAK4613183.1 hypothetical protein CLAFUR0_13098 [Fulvia fulva]UJO24133.1 hypothetical protein CLAFUR5_12948 [Fulvia fulva]WPV21238.1 hypothetical protein CLAFUW4_13089 [Fulvia fulva]WPV36091.1 hypothetical protein CLAFUW7_13097 [Fulvia fulva]
MGRHVRSPSHLPSLRRSDLLPNSSFTSLLPSASRSISQTHPHHDHFHHAHTITMSLHFRAILYTTDPQPQHLPSLISELQHELLKPELVTAPEQKDLRRRTCETLATSLHIPPFDRIQLLLMAANCHPPTSLRARRVRVEFARFWVEVLKEDHYHRGLEVSDEVKWLEYDVELARERLNEMTVEVMVEEWKQGRFEGLHVDRDLSESHGGDGGDDFSEKMFEHPIFSLEWAMWQDREMQRMCESA